MELKIMIVGKVNVKFEDFPGAKTIEEITKMQQDWINDETCSIEDMYACIADNAEIFVEAVKE